MIILLHNIRSLHNVGSILRTADCVGGVEKVYLCGITPSPLDRFGVVRGDVAKVALGAEKTVAWESVKSTGALIARLKKQGFMVVALEQAKGSIPYYEYGDGSRVVARDDRGSAKSLTAAAVLPSLLRQGYGGQVGKGEWGKIALVLGAEVEGILPAILKKCDKVIEIPMHGSKESLNVSVAFGIAAFALRDSSSF